MWGLCEELTLPNKCRCICNATNVTSSNKMYSIFNFYVCSHYVGFLIFWHINIGVLILTNCMQSVKVTLIFYENSDWNSPKCATATCLEAIAIFEQLCTEIRSNFVSYRLLVSKVVACNLAKKNRTIVCVLKL